MSNYEQENFEFVDSGERSGIRLYYLQLYNWGTFNNQIVTLPLNGESALLSGDNGTGKSTIVDAMTSVLYPSNKAKYNSSSGSRKRERKLEDYFLGVHNTQSAEDDEYTTNTISHRSGNHLTIVLAHFENKGFLETVTLGLILYKSNDKSETISKRYFISDNNPIKIEDLLNSQAANSRDFLNSVRSINEGITLFESYKAYADAYRARFRFKSAQPIELFHQTISMKEIENFTSFIRRHMLEYYDPMSDIEELYAEYEQLEKMYNDILRIEEQILQLNELAMSYEKYVKAEKSIEQNERILKNLDSYFTSLEIEIREKIIKKEEADKQLLNSVIEELERTILRLRQEENDIDDAIRDNGGDRIGRLERELENEKDRLQQRRTQFNRFSRRLHECDMPEPKNEEQFLEIITRAKNELEGIDEREKSLDDENAEKLTEAKELRIQGAEIERELQALAAGGGNVPRKLREIRDSLCEALNISSDDVPFLAELIAVKEEAALWEGAIEKLLSPVSLQLLIPEELKTPVEDWLHSNYLNALIKAIIINPNQETFEKKLPKNAAIEKLQFREDHPYKERVKLYLSQRFSHIACDNMDDFHNENYALSQNGLIKDGGSRLRKDDRRKINDRRSYVIGWDSRKKIQTLQQQLDDTTEDLIKIDELIAGIKHRQSILRQKRISLEVIAETPNFKEIDWKTVSAIIEEIKSELEKLAESSDVLHTLMEKKDKIKEKQENLERESKIKIEERGGITRSIAEQNKTLQLAKERLEEGSKLLPEWVDELQEISEKILKKKKAPSFDNKTPEGLLRAKGYVNASIQETIAKHIKEQNNSSSNTLRAMDKFRLEFPDASYELGTEIQSAVEYVEYHKKLKSENLPQYKQKFKDMLHQGTIQRVVTFNANLDEHKRKIQKGIKKINDSMAVIDFDPGIYIQLKSMQNNAVEIKEFIAELHHAASNTITGDDSNIFNEEKFMEVQNLIQRMKNQPEWTKKVTDVRNWHVYHIESIRRSDGSSCGIFKDSSGKSGGEKEKFAYTILAASLAYQYGMEIGQKKSKAFHFTVIDEAFQRASDVTTKFGMNLFKQFDLQLLLITPNKGIPVIEQFVSKVGITTKDDFNVSSLIVLDVKEYDQLRTKQRQKQQKLKENKNAQGISQ